MNKINVVYCDFRIGSCKSGQDFIITVSAFDLTRVLSMPLEFLRKIKPAGAE